MDLIQPTGEQPSLDKVRAQFKQGRHSRRIFKSQGVALGWYISPFQG